MQERISHREFCELLAMERMSPPSETLIQLYLAQLALLIAESNRDAKQQPEPFKLSDFLMRPKRRKRKRVMQDSEIEAFFRALAGAQNGNYSDTGGKSLNELSSV